MSGQDGLTPTGLPAIVIGKEMVFAPVSAGRQSYWFSSTQVQFLLAHQRLKNVDAAALEVGKDSDWAKRFLASKKWRAFRDAKLELARAQNGITLDRLMQFNEWTLAGKRTWYDAKCEVCKLTEEWSVTQAEMTRNDEMAFEAKCDGCFGPMTLTQREEKFEPTREQVVVWQEDLARIWPKVERIAHQFEKSTFEFVSGGETQ